METKKALSKVVFLKEYISNYIKWDGPNDPI